MRAAPTRAASSLRTGDVTALSNPGTMKRKEAGSVEGISPRDPPSEFLFCPHTATMLSSALSEEQDEQPVIKKKKKKKAKTSAPAEEGSGPAIADGAYSTLVSILTSSAFLSALKQHR